jgi:nitroreductase
MSEGNRIPLDFKAYGNDEMLERSKAFYEDLKRRRTVRDYSPDRVDQAIIENAIRTAGSAPSGANLQPWHFAAVSSPTVKREIRLAAEAEERAFYKERAPQEWLHALKSIGTDADKPFLEIAPWLIAVFVKNSLLDDEGNRGKTYYATESTGIATGMLIAALHHAGLATLTHTPSPMKFLGQILQRPANERAFLLLVVGLPAPEATVPDISRHPLEEIATFFVE